MHRKSLIAIAVGSILGAALPQAYAADQQPAAAPSQTNPQQAATTTTDVSKDQRDVARG